MNSPSIVNLLWMRVWSLWRTMGKGNFCLICCIFTPFFIISFSETWMTQWLTTLIFHVWDNTGGYLTFQKGECIWLSGSCLFGMFAHVPELWLVLLRLSILIQNKTHTAVAGGLEVRLFLCRKYWGAISALIGLHIIFWSIHVFSICLIMCI